MLTRQTDAGLYEENAANKKAQDLKRRCQMIEELEPLVTVSIHQNSYQDPSVQGPQVFYYGIPGGKKAGGSDTGADERGASGCQPPADKGQ